MPVWNGEDDKFEGFDLPRGDEASYGLCPPSNRDMDLILQHFNGLSDQDAELINSPDHYTTGGMETIEVLRAKLTPEEYRGYLKGNVLKYLCRANYKGHHDQDIYKAEWYISELASYLEEQDESN